MFGSDAEDDQDGWTYCTSRAPQARASRCLSCCLKISLIRVSQQTWRTGNMGRGTYEIVQTASHLTGPQPSSYSASQSGGVHGPTSISSSNTISTSPRVHLAHLALLLISLARRLASRRSRFSCSALERSRCSIRRARLWTLTESVRSGL